MSKKLKILYGIQSTGNGHISRSKIIIEYLNKNYSDRIEGIDICLSGNFCQVKNSINPKYKFHGLNLNFSSGTISLFRSMLEVGIFQTILDSFRLNMDDYDIIISDFEPITCWAGLFRRRKVLGIGNHYNFLSNKKFLQNLDPKYFVNKIITKIVSPVSKYISFDYLKEDDGMFPIINTKLREGINYEGEHYVFYLTTIDLEEQIKFLSLFPKEKIVIYHPSINHKLRQENLELCPINPEEFQKHLLGCRGVICHAGFQLTSECLYLGKKLGVIPISYQVEQIYNMKKLKSFGVMSLEWKNIQDFDKYFEHDFSVRLNYIDELDRICKVILNHKS